MIRSMTGYGRGQSSQNGIHCTVEIRSVNHRFFECAVRYPRGCAFLEEKLKSLISSEVARGKLDVYVTAELQSVQRAEIEINHELATAYVRGIRELADSYALSAEISASELARNPDIFTIRKEPPDEALIWASVEDAARQALASFLAMREAEGEKLRQDIAGRADVIMQGVAFIEERSPKTVQAYRQRLEARIRELLSDANVDEQRLLTETAVFADKIAVAEETVRLRSHYDQLQQLLSCGGTVGRKLDFLLQEFGREVNTIGSKAQDAEIAKIVVDLKAELEKIREQIQNIE